ncbi:MAG: Asparagine synthetase [glutamine-hydrolyzing] 1 [Alphaproteobacteria bacterium MarineAlpha9_Bin4]|nr:MAG: Asparagine synthetase [glutamine-hydrolyzing] 1 [Alphaproteobacteria bacterium MarineAlpha9_Bin4]|tara:strand:- start:717 stop:2576 length:1860 start_codon:yes stop_codon:yes gene_type:complete
MCGFVGTVNIKNIIDREFQEKRFKKASLFLKQRGPDEQAVWSDKNSYFLHTRLKILDLKNTGSQPMEYGDYVICYNGEIYNFQDLKNKLIKKGYRFKSSGDTEILLASWICWGPDILKKLDGMFAFSIWDKKKKTLYLARDRFGKKPLVFSAFEKTISFSSDIRSLKEIAYAGKIDKLAVESLFRFRFIYEPLTIYNNFKKLPAGCYLKFSSNGIEIKKWFSLNKKTNFFLEEESKKKIVDLTTKAVEKRLISDVSIGVFLSGGIDSGIISACLAKLNKKIPHFTVGFKNQGNYYDEASSASKLSKYFGFEHNIIYLDSNKIKPQIEEIISTCDEPFADSSSIATYMIAKETSQHIKVALSGDGGDEIFGGYRKYMAYRWYIFTHIFPHFLRKKFGASLPNFKKNFFSDKSRKIKRFLLNASSDFNKMQINFLDQLSNNEYSRLFGIEKTNLEEDIFDDNTEFDDDLNHVLARDIKFSLSGDMLVKADRFSMRHSLEVRSPFLDKDLVNYAFSISGKEKIGFFKGKKILRKAFLEIFPEKYLNLPKKGFEVPLDKWLLNDLKYLVNKSSSNKVLDSLGIKDKKIVEIWKNEFFSGKSDNSWKLWTLISYAKWAEFNRFV